MKHSHVAISWKEGLHLRPATRLVKRARAFQSSITLKVNERLADARSLLAVLLLCATAGSVVRVEVSGADEEEALLAITSVFDPEHPDAGEPAGTPDDGGKPIV